MYVYVYMRNYYAMLKKIIYPRQLSLNVHTLGNKNFIFYMHAYIKAENLTNYITYYFSKILLKIKRASQTLFQYIEN